MMLVPILIIQAVILCIFLCVLCYRISVKKRLIDDDVNIQLSQKNVRLIKYLVVILWVTLTLIVAVLWFWFFVIN